MDIEILDSYPTIEILGILYTSAQKQKANKITVFSTDTVFKHCYFVHNSIRFIDMYNTTDALRNPVTSNKLLLNCGKKSSFVI
jgi:hypothetical protein